MTQEDKLLDESHTCQRLKIRTIQFEEIDERLNMCCVLWKINWIPRKMIVMKVCQRSMMSMH